jgi:16S rRNA (uracil1498-N3)-methyltransferase
MNLPCFYAASLVEGQETAVLDEDTSRHCIQVLRLKAGERMRLTNGKGHLFLAEIRVEHKRSVTVNILSSSFQTPHSQVSVGISLVKNASRFEWFLEKATEIGVLEIIPLLCERTERQHFRYDRMKNILVSAMLQSQQVWLPTLHEPVGFETGLERFSHRQKFIAHCLEENRQSLTSAFTKQADGLVLIGPEGDFSPKEIELALQKDYIPVMLGETRLRTETAGIVAVTLMNNI